MIDLNRIRRQPTWSRVLAELLSNAFSLSLILYGLKCIVTLHGHFLVSSTPRLLRLRPVEGDARE